MTYDDIRVIEHGQSQPVSPQQRMFARQFAFEARRAVSCYTAQARFFEALNKIGWQTVYHLAADTRYRLQGTVS